MPIEHDSDLRYCAICGDYADEKLIHPYLGLILGCGHSLEESGHHPSRIDPDQLYADSKYYGHS